MTPDSGSPFGRPSTGGRFGPSAAEEPEPVVVRDRRRVSPHGVAQKPAPAGGHPASPQAASETEADVLVETVEEPAELAELTTQLSERTADLQRLKAEYDNYRRRVERDRQASADQAAARVLGALLGTLDDLDRARQHDDLHGSFRAVAEGLEAALSSVGLERYGKEGEPFDPQVHEALVHSYQSGLEGPTCIEVYRAGYRHAGRVLRPAQVVVAESPAPEASADGIS